MTPLFVLVHSPLVGPFTWVPVANELQRRGQEVLLPELIDDGSARTPYWKQHAKSVARSLESSPVQRPVILVGHSGAGPLLPAIRAALAQPVTAYIFVDAGVPQAGSRRLGSGTTEDSRQWAEELRQHLRTGGRFPTWSFDDLAQIIPNPQFVEKMLSELRPRGLDYWEEPIPVFEGWPDAACVYLQFSPVYDEQAAIAQQRSWPYSIIAGGHFHMLVDPPAVAEAIIGLVDNAVKAQGLAPLRE
jgi:hypothetical protein